MINCNILNMLLFFFNHVLYPHPVIFQRIIHHSITGDFTFEFSDDRVRTHIFQM